MDSDVPWHIIDNGYLKNSENPELEQNIRRGTYFNMITFSKDQRGAWELPIRVNQLSRLTIWGSFRPRETQGLFDLRSPGGREEKAI